MFEPLGSRQFFSVASITPVNENQSVPAPVEQSVNADDKKGSTKSAVSSS